MKTLQLKSIAATLALCTILFTSCKKDKEDAAPAPPPTIEGTWVGEYTLGNEATDTYFSFIINKDGTLKVTDDISKPEKNSGTWKLEGDNFAGTYQTKAGNLVFTYHIKAKYKAQERRIEGSWSIGNSDPLATFYLDKKG